MTEQKLGRVERAKIGVVTLFVCALTLMSGSGCSSSATVGEQKLRVNPNYPESQVFYRSIEPDTTPGSNPSGSQYRLLNPREALNDKGNEEIEPGSSVTVTAQRVRLPRRGAFARNMAVVVNVAVVGSESTTEPLLVHRVEGAKGGQRLPLLGLRVFSTDTWNPEHPPRFRVRVVNLYEEDNESIREGLRQAGEVADILSARTPVLSDPVISTSIEAANALLGMRKNNVVLDFDVQMYSGEAVKASANQIPLLRKGSWMVAASHKSNPPTFWEQDFTINDKSQLISGSVGPGEIDWGGAIDMPYLEVNVAPVKTSGSNILLLQDAQNFFEKVNYVRQEQGIDAMERAAQAAWSSATGHIALERFRREPSEETMYQLVHLATSEERTVSPDTANKIRSEIARVVQRPFASQNDISVWWTAIGSRGTYDSSDGREQIRWKSPVDGWIDSIYTQASDNGREVNYLSEVDALVNTLKGDLVQTEGGNTRSVVGNDSATKVVRFLNDIRRNGQQDCVPFVTADAAIKWWSEMRLYGDMDTNEGVLSWKPSWLATLDKYKGDPTPSRLADLIYWVSPESAREQLPKPRVVQLHESQSAVPSVPTLDITEIGTALAMSTGRNLLTDDWAGWYILLGSEGSFAGGQWISPISKWAVDVSQLGGEGNFVRRRVTDLVNRIATEDGQHFLLSEELSELRRAVPFHRVGQANHEAELKAIFDFAERLRQRYTAEDRGIAMQPAESDRDLYIWALRNRCVPTQGPVPMRRLLVAMREVTLDRRLRDRSPLINQAYNDAADQLNDILREKNDDDRADQWPTADLCSAALDGQWVNQYWVYTIPAPKP